MKLHLARLSLLLLLACSSSFAQEVRKAPTEGPCRGAEAHWDCPGALELRDEKAGTAARLTWFSSGELLGERLTGAASQRYLVLLPSRRIFYSNVPAMSLVRNALNPFHRYDRVFAAALGALKSAHTKGPDSVPFGESTSDVQLAGETVRLTSWRKPGERVISFELKPKDGPVERGSWDPRRPAPWEDKASLEGWTDARGYNAPATTGEGRQPEAQAAPLSPASAAQR